MASPWDPARVTRSPGFLPGSCRQVDTDSMLGCDGVSEAPGASHLVCSLEEVAVGPDLLVLAGLESVGSGQLSAAHPEPQQKPSECLSLSCY